jgi:hypothetical protein
MISSLGDIEDMLNQGKYPVFHPKLDPIDCTLCCLPTKEFLLQCTHYIIIERIYCDWAIVRFATHSSYKGKNILVEVDQFVPEDLDFFVRKNEKLFNFYSPKEMNLMLLDTCMSFISYKGYFKYLK